jgi:hypothetical protein
VGRNVLVCEEEDVLKAVVAAVAAGKTLAASADYKRQVAALGEPAGLLAYVSSGPVKKLLEGENAALAKVLSADYGAAFAASLTRTGLTVRSTGAVEAFALLPLLTEVDRIIADMERAACRQRLQAVADAAAAAAARNDGRWPAALDELGPEFKAGSAARRSPASGKEYVLVALGKIPAKASGCMLVLCYDPGQEGAGQAAYGRHEPGGRPAAFVGEDRPEVIKNRIRETPALLALADPGRVEFTAEQRKAVEAAAADLGAEEFGRRDAANRLLREMGVRAVPRLAQLLASADAEVASRAEGLLRELTGLKTVQELKRLAGQDVPVPAPRAPQPAPQPVR